MELNEGHEVGILGLDHVLFLGDSVVVQKDGFRPILQKALVGTVCENISLGGCCVADAPFLISLQNNIDINYQVCIVCFSNGDIRSQVAKKTLSSALRCVLLHLLSQHCEPLVFLPPCLLLDTTDVITTYHEVCRDLSVNLLDMSQEATQNPSLLLADKLHSSSSGSHAIAMRILEKLKKLLLLPPRPNAPPSHRELKFFVFSSPPSDLSCPSHIRSDVPMTFVSSKGPPLQVPFPDNAPRFFRAALLLGVGPFSRVRLSVSPAHWEVHNESLFDEHCYYARTVIRRLVQKTTNTKDKTDEHWTLTCDDDDDDGTKKVVLKRPPQAAELKRVPPDENGFFFWKIICIVSEDE